jgi:hypothetical protein
MIEFIILRNHFPGKQKHPGKKESSKEEISKLSGLHGEVAKDSKEKGFGKPVILRQAQDKSGEWKKDMVIL